MADPALDAAVLELGARQLAKDLRALLATLAVGTTPRSEADVAVIGGGPIGLAYAWFLKESHPAADVTVLERRAQPDYKVGESTLGTTTRAFIRMGLPLPVLRRLFGIKAGIRFWWTQEGDPHLHDHIDATDVEETFQVERRVLETALVASARRKGIDVRVGTRVNAGASQVGADGAQLTCEPDGGEPYELRATLVCDASGRASLLPRRFRLHRRQPERLGAFNTNSYYAYFRQRGDAPIPHWDLPATRHICFPQGWCWFITVVSWEGTPQENLEAMVAHLLDLPEGPDEGYPSRRELEERFDARSETILSIGFTVREDRDTSLGESVAGRFDHYVQRYPAFGRILEHYELVEEPYGKRQPYSAFQRLAHDAEAVAGDGWCAVGDAAMFSNPLFSPGLNLGTGTAFEAAADSARALRAGDASRSAFRAYQHYTDRTYASLMGFNDMLYRSFVHRGAYERALLMFFFHSAADVITRESYSETDPYIWDLLNPEFTRRVDQIRGLLRAAEERGGDPEPVVRAVREVADGYIAELAPRLEEAGLDISRALREYSHDGRRQQRNAEPSTFTAERCATCRQWFDAALRRCPVCGTTNPVAGRTGA